MLTRTSVTHSLWRVVSVIVIVFIFVIVSVFSTITVIIIAIVTVLVTAIIAVMVLVTVTVVIVVSVSGIVIAKVQANQWCIMQHLANAGDLSRVVYMRYASRTMWGNAGALHCHRRLSCVYLSMGWGLSCTWYRAEAEHLTLPLPDPSVRGSGSTDPKRKKSRPKQSNKQSAPDVPLASAGSDMIRWGRVLLSHTLDAAHSY